MLLIHNIEEEVLASSDRSSSVASISTGNRGFRRRRRRFIVSSLLLLVLASRGEHGGLYEIVKVRGTIRALAPAIVAFVVAIRVLFAEQGRVDEINVRGRAVVGETNLGGALHDDVVFAVRKRVRLEHAGETPEEEGGRGEAEGAEKVAVDARVDGARELERTERIPGVAAAREERRGEDDGGADPKELDSGQSTRGPHPNLRVAQRPLTVRAILGVHLVRVKELARIALNRGHLLRAGGPRNRAILLKPLVKEDGHLIRRGRGEDLILPLFRQRLPVALGDDLFLLVQQNHILV